MGHLSRACGRHRNRYCATARLCQWFLIAAVAVALLYYLPVYHLLLAGVHYLSKTFLPGAHRTPLAPSPAARNSNVPSPAVRNMIAQLQKQKKNEPTRSKMKPRKKPLAAALPKAQPEALRCVIAGPFPGLDLKQVASRRTGTGEEEHSLVVLLRSFARHLPTKSRLVMLVEESPFVPPLPPPPPEAPLPPRPPPPPSQKQPSGDLQPPPLPSPSLYPSSQEKLPPSALPPDRKPEPASHSQEQPRPPPPPPAKPAREQSGVQNRKQSEPDGIRAPSEEQQAPRTGGERRRSDESSPQQRQRVHEENAPLLRDNRKQPAADRERHVDIGGAQEADKSTEEPATTKLNSERQRAIKRIGSAQKVKEEQTRSVEEKSNAQRNFEERKRPKFNSRDDNEGAPQKTGDSGLQKHVRVRREARQGEHPSSMGAVQPNVLLQKRRVPSGNEVEEPSRKSNVHTKPQVMSKESPEKTTSAAIVSRAVAELLRSFPSDRANVQVVEVELGPSSTQAIRRMKAVLKYLQSDAGQQCHEVLVSDRLDIAFQADPFAAAGSTLDTGPNRSPAAISAPAQPAALGQPTGVPQQTAINVSRPYLTFAEKVNFVGGDGRAATAITECLGDRVLQIISGNRDTVAGFVVGTRAPVLAYTQLVLHLLGLYCSTVVL